MLLIFSHLFNSQIVYYFYGYFRFLDDLEARSANAEASQQYPSVYFAVPTGNFGDALAAYYARCMGLPIAKIVVATNHNDILYRFISAGDYSARAVRPSLGKFVHVDVLGGSNPAMSAA